MRLFWKKIAAASALGAVILSGGLAAHYATHPVAAAQLVSSSQSSGASSVFGTPTTRSVSLATAYQATNSAKPSVVTITVTSTATFSLSGGTTNTASILIGSTSGVATGTGSVVGSYTNSVTGTIAVGLNMSSQSQQTYTLVLPAGWFFAVRQTGGTVSVSSAFDQSIG